MAETGFRALIISVGDDPVPVIAAINRIRPESLCFFVDSNAKDRVDTDIIPRIESPPRQWDQAVTPDPLDLKGCCRVLVERLPGMIARWSAEPSQVVVDCSSGSRTMSLALMLCAADYASAFLTGDEQTAGSERPSNVWDERAAVERNAAAASFNHARYLEAAGRFTDIQRKASGGDKPFYKALTLLSMGYAHWDVFNYREAWTKLQEARKGLEMAALFGGPPGLKQTVAGLKENLALLEKLALGTADIRMELFFDLLSNAARRASFENNFEDASLRVFRALEVLADVRLLAKGIRSTAVEPDKLPESLRSEYSRRYTSTTDGKIKIDLSGSLHLLNSFHDDVGERFEKNRNTLVALLEARDQAVLGHGATPMKQERYRQILDWVLKCSGTAEDRIPRFARMEL